MQKLADAFTRIRNAQMAKHKEVLIPFSTLISRCLNLLLDEGYIAGSEVYVERPGVSFIKAYLKYHKSEPVIQKIKVFRKDSYIKASEIAKKKYSSLDVVVLTTSKGIMTVSNAATHKIGGKLLLQVS